MDNSQCIREIRVSGGFLDGLSFEFSPRLNCIIGARGTGKTTFVELVRYALDLLPRDTTARRRVENIVGNNLKGGRVELRVVSRNGNEYVITRTQGEKPIILNGDGTPSGQQYMQNIFGIDIFSQNEVESIADNMGSQLSLIESFGDAASEWMLKQEIGNCRQKLFENAMGLKPLRASIARLKDAIAGLPSCEERLKSLAIQSGDDSKAVVAANTLRSLREREKGICPMVEELYKKVGLPLKGFKGMIASEFPVDAIAEYAGSPNYRLIAEIQATAERTGVEIDGHIDAILQALAKAWGDLQSSKQALALAQNAQEVEYGKLIEKSNADRAIVAERMKTERERNKLLESKRQLEAQQADYARLQEERARLKASLSEALDRQFAQRRQTVDRINTELMFQCINVTIEQNGNRDAYMEFLAEKLKPFAVKQRDVAAKVAERLTPDELAGMLREGAGAEEKIIDAVGINRNQAHALVSAFTEDSLYELEAVELADRVRIELKDGDVYKPTSELSTGQKCNAILPILLLKSNRTLIIDQPEDNLDNAYVHGFVVESVKEVKRNRQLVFVTHNPNIPVLGDAERILVLESDGMHGRCRNAGGVGRCKKDIINILEGGEQAFHERQARYGMDDGDELEDF